MPDDGSIFEHWTAAHWGLLLTLVANLFVLVWGASHMSSALSANTEQIEQIEARQSNQRDRINDIQIRLAVIEALSRNNLRSQEEVDRERRNDASTPRPDRSTRPGTGGR